MSMLKDISAVIFDMDGTLIDSMWLWDDINIEMLKMFNIDTPQDFHDRKANLNSIEVLHYFKELGIPKTVEEIGAIVYEMAYINYETKVTLKRGALKLLKYLKDNKIKTGLATNSPKNLVDVAMRNLQLSDYFDSIRTLEDTKNIKPSPDIFLLVADDLNTPVNKCLVFEDSIHGIMAGKRAYMSVCAVYDDFSKESFNYKISHSDYYINDFIQLLDEEGIF